jgi:hypothetical protein
MLSQPRFYSNKAAKIVLLGVHASGCYFSAERVRERAPPGAHAIVPRAAKVQLRAAIVVGFISG